MPFRLSEVVPWGRSYDEYLAMFSLSSGDLQKNILGCSDGPASFNAVLTSKGGSIISADPIYAFSSTEIQQRIRETSATILEQTEKNREAFTWNHIPSVQELGKIRMAAMNIFSEDFELGKTQKRYINSSLPELDFPDQFFDLALCSHFLFLYSEHLSETFHLTSIKELCRVASETRVFPLLELNGKKSRHLEKVITLLKQEGFQLKVQRAIYEFQKGGNEMLVISSSSTAL